MTNTVSLALWLLFQVEAGGNPTPPAGDGGRAVGPLQIWPVTVAEANRLAPTHHWTLDDRESFDKSCDMARVILTHHYNRGATDPITLASKWRNPYSPCPGWYIRKLERTYETTIATNQHLP